MATKWLMCRGHASLTRGCQECAIEDRDAEIAALKAAQDGIHAVGYREGVLAERQHSLKATADGNAEIERLKGEVAKLREDLDEAVSLPADLIRETLVDRAEKAEAERDAALAACAEMRAALTEIIARGQEQRGTGRMIETAEAALARPDLGHGWASPEDTAQMVGALQMVEGDGEFDSLHEVTRKFVVDVLARLKAEVETAKAWQGAAVLRNYDAVRILTEEIGAPGPENIDETARRAVMVIRAHKRALAAGPAALRALRSDDYSPGYVAGVVEAAQEAAMKEEK